MRGQLGQEQVVSCRWRTDRIASIGKYLATRGGDPVCGGRRSFPQRPSGLCQVFEPKSDIYLTKKKKNDIGTNDREEGK